DNNLVILRMVDDCPYPQSSAKNQSNRFLIQALSDFSLLPVIFLASWLSVTPQS
ncbi:hypothetical protein GGR01_000665, partial [Acetobacter oeni]|nr:hypothetical protein [Acetobacter oeni]